MALLLEWEWQRGAEQSLLPLAALQDGSGFGVHGLSVSSSWLFVGIRSGSRRMAPAALGFACWALSCPCLCPGSCCRLRDVGRGSHAGLLTEQAASGREGCRSSPGQLPEG